MSSLNKVILVGRLGGDPELKQGLSEGKLMCSFSIAINEYYVDLKGTQKNITDWIRVVAWDKQASMCLEYLHKGDLVYVEGKLKTREYEDTDKKKRLITEVVVQTARWLASGSNHTNDTSPVKTIKVDKSKCTIDYRNIPF